MLANSSALSGQSADVVGFNGDVPVVEGFSEDIGFHGLDTEYADEIKGDVEGSHRQTFVTETELFAGSLKKKMASDDDERLRYLVKNTNSELARIDRLDISNEEKTHYKKNALRVQEIASMFLICRVRLQGGIERMKESVDADLYSLMSA